MWNHFSDFCLRNNESMENSKYERIANGISLMELSRNPYTKRQRLQIFFDLAHHDRISKECNFVSSPKISPTNPGAMRVSPIQRYPTLESNKQNVVAKDIHKARHHRMDDRLTALLFPMEYQDPRIYDNIFESPLQDRSIISPSSDFERVYKLLSSDQSSGYGIPRQNIPDNIIRNTLSSKVVQV